MPENIPEQLIIRFLTNEASVEEQHSLFEWVSLDAEHERIFLEYVEIWKGKVSSSVSYNFNKGIQLLNSKIDRFENGRTKLLTWMKVAAAVSLLVMAGGMAIRELQKNTLRQDPISYIKNATRFGERTSATLSDGTIVHLNAGSSIRYPQEFLNEKREVYLTGEAFFDVQKDPDRPFIIHAGALTTEVLGTSFNVKSLPGSVCVAVATGKVSVTDGNQIHIVLPENKITYNTATATLQKERAALDKELAWLNNTIIFEDTSIGEAAVVIERWYGVKVVCDNDAVRTCVITGTFSNEPLENVLKAIAFSTGLKYRVRTNEVIIYGKGCG